MYLVDVITDCILRSRLELQVDLFSRDNLIGRQLVDKGGRKNQNFCSRFWRREKK